MGYFGFLGKFSAGPVYRWDDRQDVGFFIGAYSNGRRTDAQLSGVYRYAHWRLLRETLIWRPLHIGAFATATVDRKRFFLTSPKKYPDDRYYEQTALRLGAELGTTVLLLDAGISLALYFRILDKGLVAVYNNRTRDLQYFSSSGLGIQYDF